MDLKSLIAMVAVSAFSNWIHHSIILKPKSAAQADKAIGAGDGVSQAVLNAAADAATAKVAELLGKAGLK